MKKLIILAILVITACSKPVKYEKPFIIVEKYSGIEGKVIYKYQDRNGLTSTFTEKDWNKYSIGDTIK